VGGGSVTAVRILESDPATGSAVANANGQGPAKPDQALINALAELLLADLLRNGRKKA
jgi:hypothetical protein